MENYERSYIAANPLLSIQGATELGYVDMPFINFFNSIPTGQPFAHVARVPWKPDIAEYSARMCRTGAARHVLTMSRAQLLAARFGPLYVRAATSGKGGCELRFAGHHNVHMGLTPLGRAAYFSKKMPGCDLRLNKFYMTNLKYFYYCSDAQLDVLMNSLRRRKNMVVYGNVDSRPTRYTFRLKVSSIVTKEYRSDLGMILMAGLADASSVFALLLLHAPSNAANKILCDVSRMEPFFTPRCLHAAVGLLAGYATMPAQYLDKFHHCKFRNHLGQAINIVTAYLSAAWVDTAHDLQRAIDSMNIGEPYNTFFTPALNSGYKGAVQGCIVGGALKYARKIAHTYEEKRTRISSLMQFALGGPRGIPVWGFTFEMTAPVVEALTDCIVQARHCEQLVHLLKQQGASGNHVNARRGDRIADEEAFDKMLNIALEEATRPA